MMIPKQNKKQKQDRPQRRTLRFLAVLAVLAALVLTLPACEALSLPKSTGSGKKGVIRIELFDPSDAETLRRLRSCRRTAFDASKTSFLDSEVDFVEATSAVRGKNLCALAIDDDADGDGDVAVVGSADLTPQGKSMGYRNVIANVFVRPDRRGEGIGRLLLEEGIEGVLASNLPETNTLLRSQEKKAAAVLTLDVYTRNEPAIGLYRSMGYEPSSPIHAGTLAVADALGSNLVVSLSKTVDITSSSANSSWTECSPDP